MLEVTQLRGTGGRTDETTDSSRYEFAGKRIAPVCVSELEDTEWPNQPIHKNQHVMI